MVDPFWDYSYEKHARAGDSVPPSVKREADRARNAYKELIATDDLDETTDKEALFLAKMYVCAEHFGVLDKYKQLIEDAMRTRVDKVKSVAKVFEALSHIYEVSGEHANKYRVDLEREEYLCGGAADSYYAEFDTLITHMYGGKTNLAELSANTAELFDGFGDALKKWRKEIADAIRAVSEQERDREWAAAKGFALGIVGVNPYDAAKASLDTLLELWYKSEKDSRAADNALEKFAVSHHFEMDAPKYDDVERKDVVMPDPWDGSLK